LTKKKRDEWEINKQSEIDPYVDLLNQTGLIPPEHRPVEYFRHYIDAYLSLYFSESNPAPPFLISAENVTFLR